MKARSIKGDSPDEIRSSLQECREDGFNPTLAIVFISIKQDRNAVREILQKEGIDLIGATSCGEFINGFQSSGSIVVLLLELNRDAYTILFENIGSRDIAEVSKQLAASALQQFKKPAFLLCSTGISLNGDFLGGEKLVHGIEEVVGPQVTIFGGMAGDDGTFTGTWVFTNNLSTDNGIAALVLDEEKIELVGMAISGWKPLGIARTVTRSEDGWLYTIDGQPALDMYLKYLGREPIKEGDKIFDDVGLYYPFQVEDAGDPVMRTPIMVNKNENALKLDFDVPQGTRLRFSMPPDFDIVENVLEKANELKTVSGTDAEALLIFSCAGRLSALGPLVNTENEGLHKVWKAPMAGFFTYGEYGRGINGKQEFHSTTCCWVALKERL